MEIIKNGLFWLVVVYFRVAKSVNFVNIRLKTTNKSLLKSHVLHINVLNMKHCGWHVAHFGVVYYSTVKHWATKWQNLKRHDWFINFLNETGGAEYETVWQALFSIWLFRTNSWLVAGLVFLKMSITSPFDHGFKYLFNAFWDAWSQLTNQFVLRWFPKHQKWPVDHCVLRNFQRFDLSGVIQARWKNFRRFVCPWSMKVWIGCKIFKFQNYFYIISCLCFCACELEGVLLVLDVFFQR